MVIDMLKRIVDKNKRDIQTKANFSIDVMKKEHILDYEDKAYFWIILRNSKGCSSVYACGWAYTSEDAWSDANDAYERIVKHKRGVRRWFGI